MRIRTWVIVCLVAVVCSCSRQKTPTTAINARFDSILTYAERLTDSGYGEKALSMVINAHAQFTDLNLEDEVHYYSFCNIEYNKRKQYHKSISLADSLLTLLSSYENTPEIQTLLTVSYNNKADALFALGRYNDAYNYYYLAQQSAKQSEDSCALRNYSYSLAMTLYRQKRFKESALRFRDAYDHALPCPDDFNLFYFKQELLDNIGLCYNALGEYDSAMFYYGQALTYLEENTGRYGNKRPSVYECPKAVVYGNMAEVYMNLKRYDTAKKLYNKSISINLQKGYANSDAMIDQIKLASLYLLTDDTAQARITLQNVKAELDTIPHKLVEIKWYRLMWQLSERMQDKAAAYNYLNEYTNRNEIYLAATKTLMETDVDMQVRDLEKQYKINLLTKDSELQTWYIIVLSVIAAMTLVIVLLIWRDSRKSHRNVRQLTELNKTINEQKDRLEEMLVELKAKEDDKSRILKSVAHDVMNPIAAIVSLTDILLQDSEKLDKDQIEIINLIREASTNSLNLSRDILEASEEVNKAELNKEDTDINLLVAKSVELLNFRALVKNQKIVAKYPPRHIHAPVYKDKMRRVINNIIANAIKFSHENSKIFVTLETLGDTVRITVKDSGIGIPQKDQSRIFDMFTDAKQLGTSGEAPYGLGLSISLQIVRAHNGDIRFESEEGKGTTFYLTFPAK